MSATFVWNVSLWCTIFVCAGALYASTKTTGTLCILQILAVAGLSQVASFAATNDADAASVGVALGTWAVVQGVALYVTCNEPRTKVPTTLAAAIATCNVGAMALMIWALAASHSGGLSAAASVSRVAWRSAEMALGALVDSLHIMALLPMVPLLAFMLKYLSTVHKGEDPDVRAELQASRAVAFPIMVVLGFLMFVKILARTGIMPDAGTTIANTMIIGFGLAAQQWLGAVCAGFMISISTTLRKDAELQLAGPARYKVHRMGLMYVECDEPGGGRLFVPYPLLLTTVYTVST